MDFWKFDVTILWYYRQNTWLPMFDAYVIFLNCHVTFVWVFLCSLRSVDKLHNL